MTITDSAFTHNRVIDGLGGILTLVASKNQPDNDFHANIKRTLFQKNIGNDGSVLSVPDAKVVYLRNVCF